MCSFWPVDCSTVRRFSLMTAENLQRFDRNYIFGAEHVHLSQWAQCRNNALKLRS